MTERSVLVRLRANISDFRDRMREAGRESDNALGRLSHHARENEQAWEKTGKVMLAVGTAAAVGVTAAIVTFAQYDKQMSAVQAATLASEQEMDRLGGAAIKAGQDTAYSAREAAGGIEQLAKAGVSTADIMGGGLSGSLALAAAGELAVADAAEIAASTMVQFNLEGNEVGRVADTLAAGANKAQGSVQDLGLALEYAGVPAAALNMTVEETTGVLALFANNGIVGEKAGTALRAMLVSLQNPSEKAKSVMSDLNIEVFDAQGNFIGMEATAGVLQDRMSGLDQQTRGAALATIFGNESLGAATALYNGGASAVATWTDNVTASGYAAEVASQRLDNLSGDVTILRGSLETALIGLGEGGSGPLREYTQDLTTLVNVFSSMPDEAQSATLASGVVVAGVGLVGGAAIIAVPKVVAFNTTLAAMGPLGAKAAAGLGLAARGVTRFLGPIGLLIGGGLVVMDYWLDNRQAIEEYTTSLDQATGAVTDFTRQQADKILRDAGAAEAAATLGLSMRTVTEAATGNKDAIAQVDEVLARHNGKIGEGTGLYGAWLSFGRATTFTMDEQAEAADVLSRQLGIQNDRVKAATTAWREGIPYTGEVIGQYTHLGEAVQTTGVLASQGAVTLDQYAAGATGVADAAGETTTVIRGLGDVTAWGEEQVKSATEAMDSWLSTLQGVASGFVEPLSVYKGLLDEKTAKEQEQAQAQADATESSEDSWEDYASEVSISLSEYAATLEEQIANQEAWRANLVTISGRGGMEVTEILAAMGAEGADITAQMASATEEDFDRMAAALIADAQFGGAGATQALDTELRVMEAVGRAGARRTAESIATELGIGVDEVERIAAQYGVELAEGINPLLRSLGKDGVRPRSIGGPSGRREAVRDGGVLAGWTPGMDVHEFRSASGDTLALSGGEAVMRPEWVSAMGVEYVNAANAAARSGGKIPKPGRDEVHEAYAFGGVRDIPKPRSTAPYRVPISTAGDATMEKAYGEASAFVKENAVSQLSAGIGWQAMMAALRRQFPGLPLNSGYRPGAITATGNPSYHGQGRAVDIPPRMDVNRWIYDNYKSQTKELILSLPGARQVHNGRDHVYTGITKSMHYDHNHWAMAQGGLVDLASAQKGSMANPHVRDGGGPLMPGFTYNGTGTPENTTVLAPGQRVYDASSNPVGGMTHSYAGPTADEIAAALADELRREPLQAAAFMDGKAVADVVSGHQASAILAGRTRG